MNDLPPRYDEVTFKINDPPPTYEESSNIIVLGSDFMFYIGFFTSLIFNIIGCLIFIFIFYKKTISPYYGALSGFSLSCSKWIFIIMITHMKHIVWVTTVVLLLILSILFVLKYMKIKKMWDSLNFDEKKLLFNPFN